MFKIHQITNLKFISINKLLRLFILTLISCETADENDVSIVKELNSGKIYFENNICKCPDASVGDSDIIDGRTYTAVDNSTITAQLESGNVDLCTTLVTDMSGSASPFQNFFNSNSFNSKISHWDVSNVIDMDGMFFNASSFNQDIGIWDVSKVTNMGSIFKNASSFNQNLESWDTSNVTKMLDMFRNAIAFNQNLENWNTSNVISMERMFLDASTFNQDLSKWCVSNFSSEPSEFALNSSLTSANKPVWGTCD